MVGYIDHIQVIFDICYIYNAAKNAYCLADIYIYYVDNMLVLFKMLGHVKQNEVRSLLIPGCRHPII